ncbi:hypothetical protein D3C81_1755230 [compost metagenome]
MRQTGRHHSRQGYQRTGGKIDAGGDNDLGHPHRNDADNRHLQHNQQQAVRVHQEGLVADVPAKNFKHQRDADHHDKDAGVFRHFATQASEQRRFTRKRLLDFYITHGDSPLRYSEASARIFS